MCTESGCEGSISFGAFPLPHWYGSVGCQGSNPAAIPFRTFALNSPLAEGDDLLLGFTNYSVGGVLRWSRPAREVLWQSRRKAQGPVSYCRTWPVGDLVVWVKGDTELIAVDGDRLYTVTWLTEEQPPRLHWAGELSRCSKVRAAAAYVALASSRSSRCTDF